MTPLEQQAKDLCEIYPGTKVTRCDSGAHLIEVPHQLPPGWNQTNVTILFLAPPGYPAGQPDCFWIEPVGIRLKDGTTPQASNDSNPIPGVGQRGTWFSWHIQQWDPNSDTLIRYFNVIKQRLHPPR